jgi:hypothetical protein
VVFRRTEEDILREVFLGLDAVIPFDEVGTALPLAEVYDGVEFVSESDDESTE